MILFYFIYFNHSNFFLSLYVYNIHQYYIAPHHMVIYIHTNLFHDKLIHIIFLIKKRYKNTSNILPWFHIHHYYVFNVQMHFYCLKTIFWRQKNFELHWLHAALSAMSGTRYSPQSCMETSFFLPTKTKTSFRSRFSFVLSALQIRVTNPW